MVVAWCIASLTACILFLIFSANVVLPVFATDRLLLVHLFSAFPLSFFLLSKSKELFKRFKFGLILLVAFALSSLCLLPVLSDIINSLGANYLIRLLIRGSLAMCYSLTWLMPITVAYPWNWGKNWTWTLVIWLALPCVYGLKQSEQAQADFIMTSSSMRLVKALQSLNRLKEISGQTMVNGHSTADWMHSLRRQIKDTESIAKNLVSKSTTLADKLQQAMLLLSLSRATEALSLLEALDSSEMQVQLLGAITARELQDWTRVESLCREVIAAQSSTEGEKDPTPYQLLGESLVYRRKIGDALKCFNEAINACPNAIGDFEMRIGSLLGEAGDHAGAVVHFESARRADPKLMAEGTRRIAAMRNNSCQLSPH
jgi:tetratricopeptide (TPR) repeat protein